MTLKISGHLVCLLATAHVLSTTTSAQTPIVNEDFKLRASGGVYSDGFGLSCSISGDGTTVISGTPLDTDNDSYSGSAYIFDLRSPEYLDISGDGIVNASELLLIVNYWGCAHCSTIDVNGDGIVDVNGDGIVDVNDILIVIDHWEPCE